MNTTPISGSNFYKISNSGAQIINVTTTASINTASGNFTGLLALASAVEADSTNVHFVTMSFSDGSIITGNYYLYQGTFINADITYVALSTSSAPVLLYK